MRTHTLGLTAVIVLAAASPVFAQEHQHQPGQQRPADMAAMRCGGGMGMMHGMPSGQAMPGMRADSMHSMMMQMIGPPTPAMILSHKGQLGLSADQVSRLESLQKQAQPACAGHMRLGMESHRAANQLLEVASPDFAAYSAKLKEATAHLVEGHVAIARAAVAARSVLTAAQRQTLKDRMAEMHKP